MSELYLAHHGIKGQKWGIRRYQNDDGSLTEAGRKRYSENNGVLGEYTKHVKITNDASGHLNEVNKAYVTAKKDNRAAYKKSISDIKNNSELSNKDREMEIASIKKDYKAEKKANRADLKETKKSIEENRLKAVAQVSDTGKAAATGVLATLAGLAVTSIGRNQVSYGNTCVGYALETIGGMAVAGGVGMIYNTVESQKYK